MVIGRTMRTNNSCQRTRIRSLAVLSWVIAILLLLSLVGCLPWGRSDGTLRLWDSGPVTLDPAIAVDFSSYAHIVNIFSGLVRLDNDLRVVPDIAERWEKSDDGLTYTFYLREGVRFHSGREVTAADLKYSWERACRPEIGSGTAATYLGDIVGVSEVLAGTATEISGVEVIADYVLRVTIDAPRAYFLSKLAYPTAFVVDRTNVESRADWWREPSGTGPFRLKEWRPGEWLIMVRNETFYGDPVELEQVVYYLSGPPMALYELDYIDVAPVYGAYIHRARDETGSFYTQMAVTCELSLYYIGFNTAVPPFDDVNVRRAFSHAVDRERIVRLILMDMVSEASGILPPGMPGYNPALEGLDYDVERAKELIAASMYGDAANLPPITITVGGYGNYVPDYLGAIIEGWQQELGVTVSVRQLEPDAFVYSLKQEKDEMFLLGWIADYPDPHNFLDILFRSGSENNAFDYSNLGLDALLNQAAVEQDVTMRLSLYQRIERIVVDEAPCLPLWHGVNYILVRPHVTGYELNPLGIADLTRVKVGAR